jgi:hypothetical protein
MLITYYSPRRETRGELSLCYNRELLISLLTPRDWFGADRLDSSANERLRYNHESIMNCRSHLSRHTIGRAPIVWFPQPMREYITIMNC